MLYSDKDIPAATFILHERFCSKNVKKCPKCNMIINIEDENEHILEFHTEIPCEICGKNIPARLYDNHLKECQDSMKECKYCGLKLIKSELSNHEYVCGSRTEKCPFCGANIPKKDYENHVNNICYDILIYEKNSEKSYKQSSKSKGSESIKVKKDEDNNINPPKDVSCFKDLKELGKNIPEKVKPKSGGNNLINSCNDLYGTGAFNKIADKDEGLSANEILRKYKSKNSKEDRKDKDKEDQEREMGMTQIDYNKRRNKYENLIGSVNINNNRSNIKNTRDKDRLDNYINVKKNLYSEYDNKGNNKESSVDKGRDIKSSYMTRDRKENKDLYNNKTDNHSHQYGYNNNLNEFLNKKKSNDNKFGLGNNIKDELNNLKAKMNVNNYANIEANKNEANVDYNEDFEKYFQKESNDYDRNLLKDLSDGDNNKDYKMRHHRHHNANHCKVSYDNYNDKVDMKGYEFLRDYNAINNNKIERNGKEYKNIYANRMKGNGEKSLDNKDGRVKENHKELYKHKSPNMGPSRKLVNDNNINNGLLDYNKYINKMNKNANLNKEILGNKKDNSKDSSYKYTDANDANKWDKKYGQVERKYKDYIKNPYIQGKKQNANNINNYLDKNKYNLNYDYKEKVINEEEINNKYIGSKDKYKYQNDYKREINNSNNIINQINNRIFQEKLDNYYSNVAPRIEEVIKLNYKYDISSNMNLNDFNNLQEKNNEINKKIYNLKNKHQEINKEYNKNNKEYLREYNKDYKDFDIYNSKYNVFDDDDGYRDYNEYKEIKELKEGLKDKNESKEEKEIRELKEGLRDDSHNKYYNKIHQYASVENNKNRKEISPIIRSQKNNVINNKITQNEKKFEYYYRVNNDHNPEYGNMQIPERDNEGIHNGQKAKSPTPANKNYHKYFNENPSKDDNILMRSSNSKHHNAHHMHGHGHEHHEHHEHGHNNIGNKNKFVVCQYGKFIENPKVS